MHLHLEDGTSFQGRYVTAAETAVGLVSFYTGVVGYQEVITDPANRGKILLLTYPLIGNYGVNSADAESPSPQVEGVLVKEYPPYYNNFRAEGSLKDYLEGASVPLAHGLDTRAILLHLRENGEKWGVMSPDKLGAAQVSTLIAKKKASIDGRPSDLNTPVRPAKKRFTGAVLDLGAARSFYGFLAAAGIEVASVVDADKADLILVSGAPFYMVEDPSVVAKVKALIGRKPIIGFSNGASILAQACGGKVERLGFGHHGVNIPVHFLPGGTKEITVQNHNYTASPDKLEIIFENINDGTPEGFSSRDCRAVGVNFIPDARWFGDIVRILGLER